MSFQLHNILIFLLVLPLVGILSIFFLPTWNDVLIKKIALFFSGLSVILSLFLLSFFNFSQSQFQFYLKFNWISNLNFNFILGIDGISLFFILLTNLLIFLCILISWNSIKYNLKLYFSLFFFLNFLLIGVFCVFDLLFFFIFFDCVFIPLYFLIGFWGSRVRKIRAAYFFFLYTLLGSVLFLLTIIYIYYQIGTTSFEILTTVSFTLKEQKILWLSFFVSFATKIPMVPVHLWLPEAHVEAPTSGSVILAGILLKLGTYGFIRFLFPFFPQSCYYFSPLVYSIAAISIVYTSLTAIRQTDFKRIIAYTSIAHMNLVILGLFSFNVIGIEGAILQSLSHGFVASALFAIIGVIYDRYHTRTVKYYGGLVHIMPLYIFIFLFFTLSNIGLPGTGSFVGELLILIGSFQTNIAITVIGASSMILGGCYSLWLFNRIAYGNLKTQYIKKFVDLNQREFYIFLPFFLGTIIMGLYPNIFLNPIHLSVNLLIQLMQF